MFTWDRWIKLALKQIVMIVKCILTTIHQQKCTTVFPCYANLHVVQVSTLSKFPYEFFLCFETRQSLEILKLFGNSLKTNNDLNEIC